MAYTTGNAASWDALANAISSFVVGTLGSFTETYDDGVAKDGNVASLTRSARCFTHTLTGIHYMFDSKSSVNTNSEGLYSGSGDEFFIVGNMSTTQDRNLPMSGQTGDPTGALCPANNFFQPTGAPYMTDVRYAGAGGVNYWMFGDAPGAGGEDYCHVVLEVQSGVYGHIWFGVVNPIIDEIVPANGYGGYMGIGGPGVYSSTVSRWKPPMSFGTNSGLSSIIRYPKGSTPGTIQANSVANAYGGYAAAGEWATQGTASTQESGFSLSGTGGVSSLTNRMGMTQPVAFAHDNLTVGSFNSITYPGGSSTHYGTTGMRSIPLGLIPGTATCTMNQYIAQEEITLGTDTFKLFPAMALDTAANSYSHPVTLSNSMNNGASGQVRDGNFKSGVWGIAYRKF